MPLYLKKKKKNSIFLDNILFLLIAFWFLNSSVLSNSEFLYIYIYMCVCVYIYLYTHTSPLFPAPVCVLSLSVSLSLSLFFIFFFSPNIFPLFSYLFENELKKNFSWLFPYTYFHCLVEWFVFEGFKVDYIDFYLHNSFG